MESFYRTLKVELIYQNAYQTRREAQRDIFEYIEIFYNRERLHSSLGYYSPEEYAKILAEGLSALGMKIDMSTVQTNMVFFTVPEGMIEPSELVEKLKESGVLFGPPKGPNKEIRVVTHKDVFKEDILEVIEKVKKVIIA